jgi:hypothetical protein
MKKHVFKADLTTAAVQQKCPSVAGQSVQNGLTVLLQLSQHTLFTQQMLFATKQTLNWLLQGDTMAQTAQACCG